MTPYEMIQVVLAVLALLGSIIGWTVYHVGKIKKEIVNSLEKKIEESSNNAKSNLSSELIRAQENLNRMELVLGVHRDRFDQVMERIIRLEATTVTDEKTRAIIQQLTEENKRDMKQIKEILTQTIESIEELKISIAVQDAILNKGK